MADFAAIEIELCEVERGVLDPLSFPVAFL
jgi:hypothetical protein